MNKYNYCENCFNPNKGEEVCGICKHNPLNIFTRDNFIDYPIYCKYGFADCIHDPGYIGKFDKKWFIELYGNVEPSTVKTCENCDEGSDYDDEDK